MRSAAESGNSSVFVFVFFFKHTNFGFTLESSKQFKNMLKNHVLSHSVMSNSAAPWNVAHWAPLFM